MEEAIRIQNLNKTYGYGRNALRVLKDVSINIQSGEIVSIVGPSGAGKSTLLNMIGCLDSHQSGNISIMNRDISCLSTEDISMFRNNHIGFIFQLHNLLNEFTALENVMLPLLIRRLKKKEAREKSLEIIEKLNLLNRVNHKPSELSGGECQRIAAARALVGNPDIILADEPTGNLDSENSILLMDNLLNLIKEKQRTIIIVTHDNNISLMTERTITLVDGMIQSDIRNCSIREGYSRPPAGDTSIVSPSS